LIAHTTNDWPRRQSPAVKIPVYAEAQQVFGEDPRQYHLMTKSFIKDENGKVIGLNTVNVDFLTSISD
jgi:hypothetical protein